MSEAKEERIARLLSEGLDLYGDNEVAKAILLWEEVLTLDPNNADAKDYIKTADRRKKPRPPKDGAASPALRGIAHEATELIRGQRFDEAYALLESAVEADSGSLEIHGILDLVRCRLLRSYRERLGDLSRAPALGASSTDLTKFNLPSDAGFLLSMIDGNTSVTDLVSLSGMDDFDALHLQNGLSEAGLVELH